MYHFTFVLQNNCKKETKRKLIKLNNSICDTGNYFITQKLKTSFKNCFYYNLLTPDFKACVHYFLSNCYFSPHDSHSKTMKNVFYFI